MATNLSPFQALYDRTQPLIIRIGTHTTSIDSFQQLLEERDAVLDNFVLTSLGLNNRRMKSLANKYWQDAN